MAEKRNCKQYCRYARMCYAKGEPGLSPDDCPTAWRIEDIIDDTRYPDPDDIEEENDDDYL